MVLERLLILGVLVLVSTGAFAVFKQSHLRRINRKSAPLTAGRPTLFYFRTDACGTCPTQWRYLEQLMAGENGRFTLHSINVDAEPEKVRQYGVMTLPATMTCVFAGQVKEINYGLTPSHKLQKQLSLAG